MINTEIFVNGQRLELFEDIPMSLNFAIADIREPEKRNTSYSKTITIPGSKANNKIFSHAYEISGMVYGTDFNPSVKASVRVLVHSVQVFEGSLQLLKIINDRGRIEYECAMFGRLVNVFYNWGEDKLSDLDLSKYDHVYNVADIENSWSGNVKINAVATARILGTDNEGYVYPMMDYTGKAASNDWLVTDFRPAVYLKTYLDKMFSYAGFSYDCALFNESWFKRLVIPFNRDKFQLPPNYIEKLKFKANMSTDQVVPMILDFEEVTASFDNEASPYFDNNNNFNTATHVYTPSSKSTYNLTATVRASVVTTSGTGSNTTVKVRLYNTTTSTQLAFTNKTYTGTDSGPYDITVTASGVVVAPTDNIEVRVSYSHLAGETLVRTMTLHGNAAAVFYNEVQGGNIIEGSDVPMAAIVPDIKIKDLFLAIVKAFNLYVQPDKDNETKLIISPRNSFYNGGVTVDWSKKVDLGQPVEILPMGALDARRYFFTFTEDKDYDNDKYTQTYKQIYGEYTHEVANDFMTDTRETKVLFGPTPQVGFTTHTRVLPRVIKRDGTTDKPTGSLPRLLYYGGLISGTAWTFNTVSKSTYPYAGHLDSPTAPTLDLNFGTPNEVYFTINPSVYTTNNLFNAYHKQFIEEITDKDSKLITCYVHLTPMDIEALSFKNAFFLLGDNFRLNRISDYNPLGMQPAQVELIKIKDKSAFVASTGASLTSTAQ